MPRSRRARSRSRRTRSASRRTRSRSRRSQIRYRATEDKIYKSLRHLSVIEFTDSQDDLIRFEKEKDALVAYFVNNKLKYNEDIKIMVLDMYEFKVSGKLNGVQATSSSIIRNVGPNVWRSIYELVPKASFIHDVHIPSSKVMIELVLKHWKDKPREIELNGRLSDKFKISTHPNVLRAICAYEEHGSTMFEIFTNFYERSSLELGMPATIPRSTGFAADVFDRWLVGLTPLDGDDVPDLLLYLRGEDRGGDKKEMNAHLLKHNAKTEKRRLVFFPF